MKVQAGRLAEAIEKTHPGDVRLTDGETGQLDVFVDGRKVYSLQEGGKFDVEAIAKSVG